MPLNPRVDANVKLVCWNVNGIRSAHGKGLTSYLEKSAPDIICLQETKAHLAQLSAEQASPLGYTGVFVDAEKKGYSGVATLWRTDLKHPNLTPEKSAIRFGIGDPTFDREGRFVISDHKKFLLYNIYFPSGTSGDARQAYKYRFLDAFYNHLAALPKADRDRLVICGDFNICHREIDIHHPKEATKRQLTGFLPEERAWIDRFIQLGFVDCFRLIHGDQTQAYTWWSFRANSRAKNLGWRIDYFFVSTALADKVLGAEIESSVTGSDHCPINLVLA